MLAFGIAIALSQSVLPGPQPKTPRWPGLPRTSIMPQKHGVSRVHCKGRVSWWNAQFEQCVHVQHRNASEARRLRRRFRTSSEPQERSCSRMRRKEELGQNRQMLRDPRRESDTPTLASWTQADLTSTTPPQMLALPGPRRSRARRCGRSSWASPEGPETDPNLSSQPLDDRHHSSTGPDDQTLKKTSTAPSEPTCRRMPEHAGSTPPGSALSSALCVALEQSPRVMAGRETEQQDATRPWDSLR